MALYPHPSVAVRSYAVQGSSKAYQIPTDVSVTQSSHVGGIATVNLWFRVGNDPSIVVVPGENGAFYVPRNTFISFPRRTDPMPTYMAFVADPWTGGGPPHPEKETNGIVNVVWMNDIRDDHNLLINIYSCLMEDLVRTYGEPFHSDYKPRFRRYRELSPEEDNE